MFSYEGGGQASVAHSRLLSAFSTQKLQQHRCGCLAEVRFFFFLLFNFFYVKIKEGEGDGCAVSLFKVEAWGKGGGTSC